MGTGLTRSDFCVKRDRECCDVNTSLFGEDAFYREAFEDCREGDPEHDNLFITAAQQAQLKWRKTSLAASYAQLKLAKSAAGACTSRSSRSSESPIRRPASPSTEVHGSGWLNNTISEWCGGERPALANGPFWQKGLGKGLMVRDGPNYKQRKMKVESTCAMYEALTIDAIKMDKKIENIVGRLVPESSLPRRQDFLDIPDYGGGRTPEWSPSCPLPRVICINLMLPYHTGTNPFAKDAGCSVVGFFEIKPEILQALDSKRVPPWVRIFKDFFEGPAGVPGGPKEDPNRSLHRRLKPNVKKDLCGGLLKAVAYCENPQDINIPEAFRPYNGKPCLITKSGYIVKDPRGEWLEIGIDVRRFNLLARQCLCSFRNMLPKASIHYGFWIQAIDDDDMPEAMLCDLYCHGFNMVADPLPITEDPDPEVVEQ